MPLLVVDAANVVGSVPDGWWRDRVGATERVRDGLLLLPTLAGVSPPFEVVLVVEGRARGVASVPGVRVVAARGSGDDTIVDVVREEGAGRPCLVATADRELCGRVEALGAVVVGPKQVR
ncbi:MAG: NTP pyrophosphohydrolase [Alphaproteobacteria bacterium]|nr:NTP pyrophosphohydrolase [Alphaproteobacteria bacterium]